MSLASWFLPLVKPLILSEVSQLDQLKPKVQAVLDKNNVPNSAALTDAVVSTVEQELVILINKL